MNRNDRFEQNITPAPLARQLIRDHGFALQDYYRNISRQDNRSHVPPNWVLDKIADEKITGKYNTKKNNLCTTCNTYKSVNGTCLCD